MKINAKQSQYHEAVEARGEFTQLELQNLRILLRRLRFLEKQIEENGGIGSQAPSGGAVFAELEADALVFALTELGFLAVKDWGAR